MNYDSLDYLLPPVRKRCENKEFTNEFNITGDVLRSKRLKSNKPNCNNQIYQTQKSNGETFLKLTKNTRKLFLEQLSIPNHNKIKEKNNIKTKNNHQKISIPTSNIIKITVVPIATESQSSKIVIKRNQLVNRLHKTVSHTTASTNNNILGPQKPRRENCYIRETSSADLFQPRWERHTKYDDIALNRMTYAKVILNSLNMNNKGRSERISQESYDVQSSSRNARKGYKAAKEECMCNNTKMNTVLNEMSSPKNRFKLYGRLGINENDQYVLNCAATVNNSPIQTYCGQQKLSTPSIDEFENFDEIEKNTRATQANFKMCFLTDKAKNISADSKNIQCHCRSAKDVATTISDSNFKESLERKSPLIVISVYPNKGTVEDIKDMEDLIQIHHLPEPKQNYKNPCTNTTTNFHGMEQKMENGFYEDNVTRFPKIRAPSPPFKAIDKGKMVNRTGRPRSMTPLNKKSKTNNSENIPFRSRSRSPPVKTTVKETSKNKLLRQISQKSVKCTDRQKRQPRVNKSFPQKDKVNRNPVIVNAAQSSKVNPFKSSGGALKETISKKNTIKKAIIDSYTKRILMSEKDKSSSPKVITKPSSNPSSITIDIDADNERYRVLFLQDKLNTDLNIRKTLKTDKQKPLNDTKIKERTNQDDMENSREITKKTITGRNLGNLSNQLSNLPHLDKGTPGIKIRDSIEMRHRLYDSEEEQITKNSYTDYEPTIKIRQKPLSKNAKKDNFSASVKHYRGDQCCVPNPTIRDQEIRDLLGIDKPRSGKSQFVQEVLPEFIGQKMRYNLYADECMESNSSVSHLCNNNLNYNQDKSKIIDETKFIHAWTQVSVSSRHCEESTVNSYKQMVLNRNIQVFLQVEEFTKQKPIMLSRKQYEKVKKTIQKNVSKKNSQERRRLNNTTKCSIVSIGDIRKTRKQQTSNVKICRTTQAEHNSVHIKQNKSTMNCNLEENKAQLLHTPENNTSYDRHFTPSPRQAVSSMEIRYASLAHLRHVKFSSNNVKAKPESLLCLTEKKRPSVQTIFKGHKKCVTPNLGTSAYSLYSDEEINESDIKDTSYVPDEKPKKPFLRRLMSCLVMRSNRASEAILHREYKQPSMINSFDSYHINTSLGPIELSSSLYDTSISFYSNHTIMPVARMKRGFLSSVRGFLTNLKSR